MHISCTTAGMQTLQIWHQRGVDFYLENAHGKSPLFLCCRYNHPNAILFLEKIGIDILKENKAGLHPIEYSMVRGSFLCFDLLLKYKLDKRRGKAEEVDKRLLLQIRSVGRLDSSSEERVRI